jgi:hypothetical protein
MAVFFPTERSTEIGFWPEFLVLDQRPDAEQSLRCRRTVIIGRPQRRCWPGAVLIL